MDIKGFVEKCINGQLPDPKNIDLTNLVEDMWDTYYDTISSLLSELEAAAMALEAGKDVEESASLIRRLLHSIKGDSGMSGMIEVHDICHQTESAFEDMTDISASADMILKVKDWMESVIRHISQVDIAADKQEQINQIKEKPKLRALVIDDDTVCRQRLRSILEGFFDCSFAVNGQQGLEEYIESRTHGNAYDFITLDINMPELNGHETLEAIRQWEYDNGVEGLDAVKVVMTTSEDASKHIFSSFRQGCEAYVVKSGMGDKLLDEITKLGLLKVVKVQKDYAVG
jgi:CheY-like chemotaxis protein/HPt (histidine-containing phosphotransfer) domain-containing protein